MALLLQAGNHGSLILLVVGVYCVYKPFVEAK